MIIKKFKTFYNQLTLPAKATLWFTACNFILKGISFFTGPLFTRLLPPDEYGVLSVYASYEQVILILATWEIQVGAYQKGVFKYKDDIKLFSTATQALTNILTIICFLLIGLLYIPIKNFSGMNIMVILCLFCYLIFQPAYNCWLVRKRTQYKYKSAVSLSLLYTFVNIILPVLGIKLLGATADVKFCISLLGSAALFAVFYFPNANYGSLFQNKEKTKEFWKFLIVFEGPVVLHSLSFLILNQSDRIMIEKMVGSTEAAYYSVAYNLAVGISILQNSLNQSLLPWRYQMLEEKRYDKIKKVTHGLILTVATIILMFILIAPEIMRVLYTDNYFEAVWCIPPITASLFFTFLYTIFVNIESYFEKTKYIMYVSVMCGLINVGLNYVCIKWFGYIACGYTTLFSYVLFSLGHYYFMKKVLKKQGIADNIVNPLLVLLLGVCVIIISIGFTLLYDYVIVRYAILAVLLIIAVAFWKKIASLLSVIKGHSREETNDAG